MDPNGVIEIVYPMRENDKSKKTMRENEMRERDDLSFYFSSLSFFLIFTKIGPYIFVGAEGKVGLRDESYV